MITKLKTSISFQRQLSLLFLHFFLTNNLLDKNCMLSGPRSAGSRSIDGLDPNEDFSIRFHACDCVSGLVYQFGVGWYPFISYGKRNIASFQPQLLSRIVE